MPVKIGFAILSHNDPSQLLRLVTTLNAMFGEPPIACHHDFGKCSMDEALFPENVAFIRPHIATAWGDLTVALAALKTIRHLMEQNKPDWYVIMSATDYPVRPAAEIEREFSNGAYDVYIDTREILFRQMPPGQSAQAGFGRPEWIPLAYRRYCTTRFWWPRPSMKLLLAGKNPFEKMKIKLRPGRLDRLLQRLDINRPSHIYGGDFWFQANQKAIGGLLDDRRLRKLSRYYRGRDIPDESLFHSVFCNQPDLRINRDSKRYTDWTDMGPHPKWLEVSDIPRIAESGALFARKFRPDGIVKDVVDQRLLGLNSAGLQGR